MKGSSLAIRGVRFDSNRSGYSGGAVYLEETEATFSECRIDGNSGYYYGGGIQDGDGYFDYFWPGGYDNPPPGFSSADFDADDGDASLH